MVIAGTFKVEEELMARLVYSDFHKVFNTFDGKIRFCIHHEI